MGFQSNDRVMRVGKPWGNIYPGMTGLVKDTDVDGDGKKVRVLFDGYRSERADGTVIILAKSLTRVEKNVVSGTIEDLLKDTRIKVNTAAPVRSDPFNGAREHRVLVTAGPLMGNIVFTKVKGPSVEHVDLTQPLHAPYVPRIPDSLLMGDYQGSGEIEGLVGEGYSERAQEQMVKHVNASLKRRVPAERTWRALIRSTLPFTKLERALSARQFDADRLFHSRSDTLSAAMAKTVKAVK